MPIKPGQRLRVQNGDRSKDLGEGTYLGDVKLYFFRMPDGSLRSRSDAEEEPSEALLEELQQAGGKLVTMENPKIELDSGEIVYGCQTWWSPI